MRRRNFTCRKTHYLMTAVFLFFSFPFLFIAQNETRSYPFIKNEFNRLYFSRDSSSFLGFCNQLDQLSQGQLMRLNIVHMGGSHVQGGTWSNVFVSSFQNKFKTNGGGYFVFPYKIAKTNEQPYARSFTNGRWKKCRAIGKEYCQPLGMCAMNINTNDSICNFGVCLTKYADCRQVNIINVYHNFNPSFEFKLKNGDSLKVKRVDVEENGYSSFIVNVPVDSVIFELLRKDTLKKDFTVYGLSMVNDMSPGFYLAGLGANGASSSSFLRCSNLVPQLSSLHPDIVILSLGVNDTQSKGFEKEEYIEHYDSLITFIKRANPRAFIILTTTTDNFIKRKTSNKRTISAREAMFDLMEKHHVAVWDLFTIMGGYKSMTKWYKAGLAAKDKVHFTNKGYTILGNMMYEAVIRSYTFNHQIN